MKKIWIWIRERSFILLLLLIGVVYFSYTNNWKIYLEPTGRAVMWCLQGLGWGQTPEQESLQAENVGGQEELEESVSESDGAFAAVDEPMGGDEMNSSQTGTGEMQEEVLAGDLPGEEVNTGDLSVSGAELSTDREVQYVSVTEDYFSDAVFIGDSRTVGMYEYGGLEEISTFYAATGLTIYKLFDASIVEVPGQRGKQTIEEALQEKSFQKIYLMIGINEMGTGTVESFMEEYKEAVARLQELQPDAILYLQGIMKVTTQRSQKGDYIHNEGIEARNAEIAKLADNEKIFYLDVNPLICDEGGGMESSYTFDGVHLKAQYIPIWKDFLLAHAVEQVQGF